ncbi:hypothetical protein BGZ80_002544 [Entomortierella chlamydospora]|uniref:ER-bound oxygenase mpaB/mpaB'/Rubber oxygenase catalytic domain-containing protein n=1 Tax=Entomortierella chlamydospora TaxID=101097 RepID=A0A9P6MQ53_9FUNG|nr:hypothetical protein BGZ79_004074 [Entomortierella chlamydospora]KAG0009298.1 hypothetical protein BGZ80_002544 [Entomortierella chlamydospora]
MAHPSLLSAGVGVAALGVGISYSFLRRQHFARSWRKQLEELDPKKPNDTDLIIKHVVGYDYPLEMFLALNFCFYRTFCSPTIAGVYRNTGAIANTADKRACDTDLLMHIWMDYGLDSELGKSSYLHLNKIHGLHATKTRNVDFVFVLCCLVVDAIQFTNDYGWKKLHSKEKQAIWEFYHRVGERMELKDIPNSLEECIAFVDKYTEDNRSARVSKDGVALTKVITDLVCEWYYLAPPFLCRIAASVLLYQMGPTFHSKLGLEKPSIFSFALINSALWVRKQILRLTPPRTIPYKLSDVIMSTKYSCPVSKQSIVQVGPVEMLEKINA